MGKYALMGSTVATVVRTLVEGPTRSPICARMSPAMPSMGETTRVKPRLRRAWSAPARADATWASAASSAPRDAVDGGDDGGEAEVEARLVGAGPGGRDLGLGGEPGLDGVVQLLLADRFVAGQRGVARHVQLGLSELGLGLAKLALGLRERRGERPRVDLKERIALPDGKALLVDLPDEIPAHLGADLRIDESVQGADPFADDRNVPLLDGDHLDIRRRRGRISLLPAPAREAQGHRSRRKDKRPPPPRVRIHPQPTRSIGRQVQAGAWRNGRPKGRDPPPPA